LTNQEFQEDQLPLILRGWLNQAVERRASDVHLVAGYPAVLRCVGKLIEVDASTLSEIDITDSLGTLVGDQRLSNLAITKDDDLAVSVRLRNNRYRLRINLFFSGRSIGACIRLIPDAVPGLAWTRFPEDLARRITRFQHGLVLVTGVTGSGKSTTLAMIIEQMNQAGNVRIVTIEDPIEYLIPKRPGSVVTQREIGTDVTCFSDGLKYGLRQDPDVILVGEIRDSETARMALSAAETGHLVLSTMHTRDAKGAISRYCDMFPQTTQNEIRSQLANHLRAVVCQRLLDSSVPGENMELALEIMFNNAAIAAAIRSGKLESIDNYILTGRSEGMITMEESIKRLVTSGSVLPETVEPFMQERSQFPR
jgi:twitching motility protein PilT